MEVLINGVKEDRDDEEATVRCSCVARSLFGVCCSCSLFVVRCSLVQTIESLHAQVTKRSHGGVFRIDDVPHQLSPALAKFSSG